MTVVVVEVVVVVVVVVVRVVAAASDFEINTLNEGTGSRVCSEPKSPAV